MSNIRDYLLIGDLQSCALISKIGSIDWLCLPYFDSPSFFAALLDQDGGVFKVEGRGLKISSNYIKDTAIVETAFGEEFKILDFMVPQTTQEAPSHFLIRKIKGISGGVARFIFNPKPNYARDKITFKFEKDHMVANLGKETLWLHLPDKAAVKEVEEGYLIEIEVKKGESKEIVLEYCAGKESHLKTSDFEKEARGFWQGWVAKGNFFDFCREELVRSAITLKLMQFCPTGAIIASPTTSLPEKIGGERNWDYRYSWIRDATFTLYAFYVLGYAEEAEKFFEFINSIISEDEEFDLPLLYTIWGKKVPEEQVLSWSGFKNSRPVRVGNAAKDQFQLDTYGYLIDAYYFMSKRGLEIPQDSKRIIIKLVEKIKKLWREKDNSIWEIRRSPQHYTHSKVMAWVGIDRAVRMCEILGISGEQEESWRKLESELREWIWRECFDESLKSFKQYPGSSYQDATNLLFVMLRFLDKRDPQTRIIVEETCRELAYRDVFVYRYRCDDGLEGKEGAFLLCSFWLISAWAILEDVDEAERLFKKIKSYIVKNGLLSEEVDPDSGEYLGNFPQAFSHVGFIMSAYYLQRYKLKLGR